MNPYAVSYTHLISSGRAPGDGRYLLQAGAAGAGWKS